MALPYEFGPYDLQDACGAGLDPLVYNMRVELVWTLWFTNACGASLDLTMEYGVLFTSTPRQLAYSFPAAIVPFCTDASRWAGSGLP